MLFFLKLPPEENKAEKKNINGATYGFMLLYGLPHFFHIRTPMNVIKYEEGVVVFFLQQLLKVLPRRFVPVIAVYIGKVNRWQVMKNRW